MSAKSAKPEASGALRVRQVRSGIGSPERQKATLRALGLGRIGRERLLPDNREVRGMLFKIRHLVELVESGSPR